MAKPKKDEGMKQVPYRDQPAIIEALTVQARVRGRSLSDEIRLAVRLWLREAMLAQLADPVGRAAAEAEGHDVNADEKMLRRQVKEIKTRAFVRPEPEANLMDVIR